MKKLYVSIAVVALAFVFVGSAVAADWNFYGSARVSTWWLSRSSEVPAIVQNSTTGAPTVSALTNETGSPSRHNTNNPYTQSDLDVRWAIQPNSRVGANVSSGNVSGRFEYGTGVNLRILRGTWNFGSGELLIGQTYTPLGWTHYSSQVMDIGGGDEGLLSFGAIYPGRAPMIQLKFGGFKVALISPKVTAAPLANAGGAASVNTGGARVAAGTDVVIPKLELAYKFSGDKFFIDVGAGYQSYDFTDTRNNSKTMTSWVAALGGGYNFGKGYIKAQVNYDQNGAAYGLARTAAAGADTISWLGAALNVKAPFTVMFDSVANDFAAVTTIGSVLVGGGQINDMVGIEVGLGLQMFDNDIKNFAGVAMNGIESTVLAAYLNFPFTVADGVLIVPELGYIDFGAVDVRGRSKSEAGYALYFGAMWKINF